MLARVLTWAGGLGAGVVALCCVTALLPFALGALGLSSLTGALYRDGVLLPLLGIFLIMFGAGLWLTRRTSG